MFRVLLFALRFARMRREHPELFDGHAARLAIEAALAEEAARQTTLCPAKPGGIP